MLEPNQESREEYIRKLEGIIFQYERIIENNQFSIEELREQVYEYLGDALEKEEEFEALCEEIYLGTESGRMMTEEAVERLDNAAKYHFLMNKKNYPSHVERESITSPLEISRLSI